MYHTPKERMDIGRRVFAHELSKEDAAREYEVSVQSIVNYVKDYMKESRIPVVPEAADTIGIQTPNYSEMTKDQLINELMKKDIEVARAKKGYTVKGGGKTKEFSSIKDANTK